MRIAVTGGRGTLGRECVALASARGHSVVSIDRAEARASGAPDSPPGVRQLTVDVTDYDALRAAIDGCDALIHLAAHISPQRRPAHVVHNENVSASYNALVAAADAGIDRVCLASSINAIGGPYSTEARIDYLPLDEEHPSYTDDPYSLSKRILELQAESVARRYPSMSVAALRFHGLASREVLRQRYLASPRSAALDLWGYSPVRESAEACLAALGVDLGGAQVFYVVAGDTASDLPSEELLERYYPHVEVRGELSGTAAFFDSSKARRLLGWSV